MTMNNVECRKKFWASKTPEQRTKIMTERAKKRWSKISKAKRQAFMLKLQKIRLAQEKARKFLSTGKNEDEMNT